MPSFRILILIFLLPTSLFAKNYYLDSQQGNDRHDGSSPMYAWKNLQRLQGIPLNPGDSILLKSGSTFSEIFELSAVGSFTKPIVIDSYGNGIKPLIKAPDQSKFAVRIYHSSYLEIRNLRIQNLGSQVMAGRTGLKLESYDYGTSKNILLHGLDISDVNGSLVKQQGAGSGILISCGGKKIKSNFEGLIIEECRISRTQRNGIIWEGHWQRDENWFPSQNTIIRNNVLEEIPGDGIVPIACVNTLIEYNLMRKSPASLPDTEAAAGIWPWSCDQTIIQFNEVSDHKAPWDAQGFDSDYNCSYTSIQYNYSHHNDGGFVLICNDGENTSQLGNIGTKVCYNVSIDDGIRTRKTRIGMFSPSIHLAGPSSETYIYRNIILADQKRSTDSDRSLLTADSWGGYAQNVKIIENYFINQEASKIQFNQAAGVAFRNNWIQTNVQLDPNFKQSNNLQKRSIASIKKEINQKILRSKKIAQGTETLFFPDPTAVESFFHNL